MAENLNVKLTPLVVGGLVQCMWQDDTLFSQLENSHGLLVYKYFGFLISSVESSVSSVVKQFVV